MRATAEAGRTAPHPTTAPASALAAITRVVIVVGRIPVAGKGFVQPTSHGCAIVDHQPNRAGAALVVVFQSRTTSSSSRGGSGGGTGTRTVSIACSATSFLLRLLGVWLLVRLWLWRGGPSPMCPGGGQKVVPIQRCGRVEITPDRLQYDPNLACIDGVIGIVSTESGNVPQCLQ